MERREFIVKALRLLGACAVPAGSFGAAEQCLQVRASLSDHACRPAESIPGSTPPEVRDAYRFAVLNRQVLQYIPCYCGCIDDGHTSNASCYVKDKSPSDRPEFDPMSLG